MKATTATANTPHRYTEFNSSIQAHIGFYSLLVPEPIMEISRTPVACDDIYHCACVW